MILNVYSFFLGAKNKFSVECLVTAWLFATLTLTSIPSRSKSAPIINCLNTNFEQYECIKGTKATLTRLHILYQNVLYCYKIESWTFEST